MRAMVASILELSPGEIPHFLEDGTEDTMAFIRRVNDFLRPFNLCYLPITQCREYMGQIGIRGLYHEASGQTDRGTCHACVALDGEIIHDPNPSRSGLLSIEEYGVFVVLDPSKPIGLEA